MTPLKIVQYQLEMKWSVGGVMRAVLDSCAVLASRGHNIQLMTCYADDVPSSWISGGNNLPNVTQLDRPGASMRLNARALASAERIIADADVVHLNGPWAPSNLQIAHIAKKLGKPYVLTIHGMLDDWSMSQRRLKKRIYLMLAGRKMLEQAAMIHCTAIAELEQARKWFSNPRTVVLPYLFDLAELIELPGPQLATEKFEAFRIDRPKLLFLSRLHPKKGIELLLQAAAILRQQGASAQIIIAGEGTAAYESSLRSLITKLNIQDDVTFLGLVTGPLKLSVYQAADIFVLPTSQENYGLVLPESLACRTPAITTKGVDIWQELQQAGVAIADPNPNAIADAIAQWLPEKNLRKTLGERGRQWVLDQLEPQRLAEKYEQLYAACVESGRSITRGESPR